MKTLFAAVLVSAGMLLGCSRTKTVNVIAMTWGIGQHEDCVYKNGNLYCVRPTVEAEAAKRLSKGGKALSRSDVLFHQSVDIVANIDKHPDEIAKEKDAEQGTYDASFSSAPADYSIWDCLKTGTASPGISCTLARKVSGKEDTQFIAQREKELQDEANRKEKNLQYNAILKKVTIESLQAKCGKPDSIKSDSISKSLIYTSGAQVPITFKFYTFGNERNLNSAESPDKPDKRRDIFWWKDNDLWNSATTLVEAMPCLQKE
jgi:hypothetical protein